MKIYYTIFLLSIIILNGACTSDDDNLVNEPQKLILGNWYIINKVINGKIIPYDDHENCGRDYLEFKEDGSVWFIDVWDCEKDFSKLGSYKFENNILELKGEVVEILKLDSKHFSTRVEYDYDKDGEIDEVIENFEK